MTRLIIILLFCSLSALADDWPTFRHDSQRSAVSPETIKLPLAAAWVHTPSAPPQRAWSEPKSRNLSAGANDLTSTLDYDLAYHAIVANNRVYYGSSATDTICCLAADGRPVWSFTTEGPVRLAPVYAENKIYAGSDDGHLYCLAADSGELLWRYQVGSEDRRLPGNGRVISQWPVRCGLIVERGLVYFCAGLFPSHGVIMGALDANNGQEKWTQPLGISPQGYLLTNGDHLFVPTGRTPFREFSMVDGVSIAKLGKSTSWGKRLHGGCFGVVIDGELASGPSEDGKIDLFSKAKSIVRVPGLQILAQGDNAYLLTRDRLMVLDRTRIATAVDKRRQESDALRWECKIENPRCMAKTRNLLLVGGRQWIAGFALDSGERLWNQEVTGTVESIAVSEGRVFASTDDGRIHCLVSDRAGKTVQTTAASSIRVQPLKPDPLAKDLLAKDLLAAANLNKGYSLVLGLESGHRLAAIARGSDCRVIGRDPDPARVRAAREYLTAQGLYGTRVVVHQGSLENLPYTDYFANLITSERENLDTAPDELLRVLRPHGGLLYLPVETTQARRLTAAFPGARMGDSGKNRTLSWNRPKLPGAGEWAHFYADPANTACSQDQLKSGPMRLQWFGAPGPQQMTDRHNKASAPLYKNGHLFVPGLNRFFAVDAYNGAILWDKDVPDSSRIGAMRDGGNMAVADDVLLVAAGSECISIDPPSGRELKRISVEKLFGDRDGKWAYLSTVGDVIYGSVSRKKSLVRREVRGREGIWRRAEPLVVCSDRIFAVQKGMDQLCWQYQPQSGVIINPTITIANGRIHFIQSDNPETQTVENGQVGLRPLLEKASLLALDAQTGKLIWQQPVNLQSITDAIYLCSGTDTLIVTGSHYREVSAEERRGRVKPEQALRTRYEVFAYDCSTGRELWSRLLTPNRDHELRGVHGINIQHPAIVRDRVYGPGFAFHIRSGKDIDGWKWRVGEKCGTVSTSVNVAFSRFSKAKQSYMFDLKTGKSAALSLVSRPGCWINIIPAGGLVFVPESSAGCTCEYSIQTSLAFLPASRN